MQRLTLDEYLAFNGVFSPISDYTLDKCRFPHGLSERQKKALKRDVLKHAAEYQEKRNAAIKEYERLVSIGEIEPKDRIQVLIERAKYGHPDNMSTQAARRVCKKRGIDWENYTDWNSYIKVS